MQIFRFDEDVSIPVSQYGSRFKIGPVTSDDARVRVQVLHLPADGLIGRHEAGSRQLFAVVAGSGWVSGCENVRRQVRAGQAAVWETGESHEAGTAAGLTALSVEGVFEIWAVKVTQEIVVRDYDPEWPDWFAQVCNHVWPAVAGLALRIDHVGSTSVPGLAAKPVIDMDIVVASDDSVRAVIERLADIGYRWRGELGVVGRQAFASPTASPLPAHHLYVVVENNRPHLDHWLLRDLLRVDPDARQRYGTLKRRNIELADGDMDVYVAAKAELVAELLTRARSERGFPPVTYWDPGSAEED